MHINNPIIIINTALQQHLHLCRPLSSSDTQLRAERTRIVKLAIFSPMFGLFIFNLAQTHKYIHRHFQFTTNSLCLSHSPTLTYRKNHTNAVCVPNRFQRPAISSPICTFTVDRGRSSATFARAAFLSTPTSKTISSCTQVSE